MYQKCEEWSPLEQPVFGLNTPPGSQKRGDALAADKSINLDWGKNCSDTGAGIGAENATSADHLDEDDEKDDFFDLRRPVIVLSPTSKHNTRARTRW